MANTANLPWGATLPPTRDCTGGAFADEKFCEDYLAYLSTYPVFIQREAHEEFLAAFRRTTPPEKWHEIDEVFGYMLDEPDALRLHRLPSKILRFAGIDLYRIIWDFQRRTTIADCFVVAWSICIAAMIVRILIF